MNISVDHVLLAIAQHYRHQTQYKVLTQEMIDVRLEQVNKVLNVAEGFPGFSASEVFAIAYIAAQLQISEDTKL